MVRMARVIRKQESQAEQLFFLLVFGALVKREVFNKANASY